MPLKFTAISIGSLVLTHSQVKREFVHGSEHPAVGRRSNERRLHLRQFAVHDIHRNILRRKQLAGGNPEISYDRGPQLTRRENDSQQ